MERRRHKIFSIIIFATLIYLSNGCQMEGVSNWFLSVSEDVLDTFRGNVLDRSTSNIEGINSITYGEGMNGGPYLDVSFANSRFVMATNAAYENYEENETLDFMGVTVSFRCTGGSTSILVFEINVIDTNNNAPQFKPTDEFVFTVAPPLPPGYMVTGCFNDITVRDIDLTTQRIDFEIEDNPYFEIAYDAASSTVAKEFKAILRTKTFIRSLPDPVSVKITATDVDLTNDPPLTTSATVTISGDTEFEFPEEPVFTQAFYLANYAEDQVAVLEPISLQSGYHAAVRFTLEGEHSSNFGITQNGNQISLQVVTPLSADVLREKQIFLVVRADREYASGGSAAIIVRLPEDVALEFERAHYEGTIENNNLQVSPLILTQGYETGSVSVVIFGDYSSYFRAVVQENNITLSMVEINENVINENSFIYLQVDAISDSSNATTVVTLEIIKDDNITPVFDKPIYTGTYSPDVGLTLDQIVIIQGYDETVTVTIDGDHVNYFQLIQNGSVLSLNAPTIPPEIYNEQRILLSVEATKPRTVGANAAVVITLPVARQLDFEEFTYRGTLQDNVLDLEPIILSNGYDENVNFTLTGDYATYFSISSVQNVVTINLMTNIPESIILENNIVILTLTAAGLNAVTTTTSVLLDIIKSDVTTPVFSRNIYMGTYVSSSSVNIEDINLIQGFDDTVTFRLDGEHSQYFEISIIENNVALSLRSAVPENIIFNEKVLAFNVLANKPLSVGANAAILITFPSELTESAILRFSQNTYTGTMENNILTLDTVVLNTGYTTGTEFLLSGDYANYFTLTNTNNVVSISLLNPLPSEVIENNTFIVLDIEARRERAVNVWTSLVIDIIKQEVIPPVFTEAYYTGVYSADTGLQFDEVISLWMGYDESVTFGLEGDSASYFTLTQQSNALTLTVISPIPESVLENNNNLLFVVSAYKPKAITARAAISIDIHKDNAETIVLRFAENSYVGAIENNQLQLPTITLIGNNTEVVDLDLIGAYASYFGISRDASGIRIILTNELPTQIIEQNAFIILELTASYPDAISGQTTIVLEIFNEQTVAPIFEQAYYVGEYSEQNGLLFENTIRLIQGFDESVSFTLDGDDAQRFILVQNGLNDFTITMINTLPTERSHLVFTIVATKPGVVPTRAAIIISRTDFSTGRLLRFTRDYYAGTLEGSNVTLDAVNLEGYSSDVTLSFTGDYVNYFQLTNQDGLFTLQLLSELPDEIITTNNVFIFTLEAQIENTRTHTTIILEIVRDVNSGIEVAFEDVYYVGSYSDQGGLDFESQIKLGEGTHSTVSYTLEGNHSEWFTIVDNGESITIALSESIPDEVLESNLQLIFLITAQSPGSNTAKATIIISIIRDRSDNIILGFEQVTYLGNLQNNTVNIQPIILTQGYNEDVIFTLSGGLSNYFSLTAQGSVVAVDLLNAIPEELIPSNRIIVLEIQAAASQAVSAFATILFEVEVEDTATVVQPVFDKTYYTGSYSTNTGLYFETPIILAQGYDDDIYFSLEGESSQWFGLVINQNSVTLTLTSSIPSAVLVNNQQLIFVITAQKTGSYIARATIVINLTDEYVEDAPILGFDRLTYVGYIESNAANVGLITLIEGYTNNVSFTLLGELSNYFSLTTQESAVTVALQSSIPEELIPSNRIIILEIQASAPQALSASATIVFEVVVEDNVTATVQLIFDEAYYIGSYSVNTGLHFETPITLSEGYDEDVTFNLEGDSSQWFNLVQTQNSVALTLVTPIPNAILATSHQIVFVVTAQRPGSFTARSTIVISLTDELIENASILGFDRLTYIGSIQSNTAIIEPIILIEGYSNNVTFNLFGELSTYFTFTVQDSVVNISLRTSIPNEVIPSNRIIVLEIQASAPQAVSAASAIVFEVVAEDDVTAVVQPIFEEAYYIGSYNSNSGLLFETPISLAQGYDIDVTFSLVGESSLWFNLVQNENIVSVTLSNPIPAAVLMNNHQLVFVITAQRPGIATAQSTIVISLTEEFNDEAPLLGFDRLTYLGSVQNSIVNIDPITLIEGYSTNVSITLFGELSTYFGLTTQGSVTIISLQTPIPEEQIPTNRIIVLEIQASAPLAVSASATIVFEVIVDDDTTEVIQPIFEEAYYTGSYDSNTGLLFETAITLSQGYSPTITFSLEGENSQWFSLVVTENSATLTQASPIPTAVLVNNQQLVFVITAQKPGSATARSAVIISLLDEYTENAPILGFDQLTYVGSIQSNTASIGPITLVEGYSNNVTFSLFGELSPYFTYTAQGSVVTLSLRTSIPGELIPSNRIIILEIQASAPQAVSASAAIVFEVVIEDDMPAVVQPIFEEAYYIGTYNSNSGLLFETPISLAQGYGTDVTFSLVGESSLWFNLMQNENSVTVILSNPIPAAVLMNNHQLVFVISAQRPGSATAQSTIVISLTEEFNDEAPLLGFDRLTYLGSVQNSTVNIDPITLMEGYSADVSITLFGELSTYFGLTTQGSVTIITLQTPIPEEQIPTNRIIVLEIQASAPLAVSASATIVFEVIVDDDTTEVIQPIFEEAYYTGSYDSNTGLLFETPITLSQGYSPTVTFSLEGENSQWFSLVVTQNSATLTQASPIPTAVLVNNQQLVFVITAQKPGSATARSAVIISLLDEYTENAPILGFDQLTYVGSIQSNTASIGPITLVEGYSNNVTFSLFGELSPYFTYTAQGSVVTLLLRTSIPGELIPSNRIIILEIQASAPQAVSASAAIVFEVVIEDDMPAVVQPIFEEAYYIGTYNSNSGLLFETPISLAQGYGTDVTFSLVGESSLWFNLMQNENSVTVILSNPIPAAVLMNNHQLVFVISAQRPGSATAQSTIVISLTEEFNDEAPLLGFDRLTYLGSVQNSTVNIDPITLMEGYSADVSITLFGELSTYFGLTTQGSVTIITLQTPIPEEQIPTNRIIVLEIQASAPLAVSASATIVFEVIVDDDTTEVIQPIFEEAYYTGSYDSNTGLLFETPITLSQGYSPTVTFSLEGENSQWFSLVVTENSATLTQASPIPTAVLVNNQQLVFVITAQKPGSATARSAVIISLLDEYTENASILGFDQLTYVGSIQSNTASIGPITLVEGYSNNVTFSLFGELSPYFTYTAQGSVVTLSLRTSIPGELIPSNRIIILEIQASAPQAVSASAAIVFEVVIEDDMPAVVQPIFEEAYYIGTYNSNSGLLFETPISLAQGYDTDVTFSLVGESSLWFNLMQNENYVTVILSNPIPAAVLMNNHQLVFVISAQRPGSATAQSTIVISLTEEFNDEAPLLGFDRLTYLGSVQNSTVNIDPITLMEGYSADVSITLFGELSTYFGLTTQGSVTIITLQTPIPEEQIPTNRIIVLEIQASAPLAVSASATIVFEVIVDDDTTEVIQPIFEEAYYTGSYDSNTGLLFETPITLSQGYSPTVTFSLEGENSQWFSLVVTQNSATLTQASPIPTAVLVNNQQLVFVITAQKPGSATARSAVIISLLDEFTENAPILGFDQLTYVGSIQSNTASIGPITLVEGYSNNVTFSLFGELSPYFTYTAQGSVVTLSLRTSIPGELIPSNRIIILEIQASAPQAVSASAAIVFEVVIEDDMPAVVQPIFEEAYYIGTYNSNSGLLFETPISLAQGYDTDVTFSLVGDNSQWFSLVQTQNSVTLTLSNLIPAAVLVNNHQLVFVITAQRPGSTTAQSTIVISLTEEFYEEASILGFDRLTYIGSVQNNLVNIDPITLIEGYSANVSITLFGELSAYFGLATQGSLTTIVLRAPIPDQLIPANRIIVLEIQASAPQAVSAAAAIVIEVVVEDELAPIMQPVFEETYYSGSYSTNTGLQFETHISLSQGYGPDVLFTLEGETSQWFSLQQTQNSVLLTMANSIPAEILLNNRKLINVITAQRPGSAIARATIIISITEDLQTGNDVSFEKVLYDGFIRLDTVQHESIRISGYNGTTIDIHGEYSSLFVVYVADGLVSVQASGSLTLPSDVTSVPLELHAVGDRAVLLLRVLQADVPVLPSVTFSSPSYAVSVEIVQTGMVGQVQASADNGEAIIYSLNVENAHLLSRISINNEGELHLSAPAESGVYTFEVIATTAITQATATATVYLTVTAVTVCGQNDFVVPPLIILDRDEEEPHQNLVVLNSTQHPGCQFTLNSRWPVDQSWLYVDENGLHATAIDREHQSIAFMALSQVQVELLLQCDSDNTIRTKRSQRTDWLGPYDYGSNKWILADTIFYNSRRSVVNLIVNDINDNAPIFVGKEREPIVVGYPIEELEKSILPRSLAELQATDADIGVNAELLYWSSESELAVAPTTGFVHLRDGARLQDNQRLVVLATDRNGEGLSGSIQLLVKLLDQNNILVVTIRDAFLNDEKSILDTLSDTVGYEVKSLKSIIVSDGGDFTRKKREINTAGASLQLYVYGLIEREPVAIDRLTADINNAVAVVNVISVVSLEDHLEGCEICVIPGRDTGLLVSTIVLAVLLFILIVLIGLWYFLRWRKNRIYNEFHDESNLVSANSSMDPLPKPEPAPMPRLNIEELKKSERRLQEMLNAPMENIAAEPSSSKTEKPFESILDLAPPETQGPIVIQSIDKLKDAEDDTDDDEFGEKSGTRRKSVVTFNENVEKIIHVEDDPEEADVSEHPGYEIYKL